DATTRNQLEEHLATCERCRHDRDLIQKALQVPSESLEPVRPRRDLWPQIERRIQEELARKASGQTGTPVPADQSAIASPADAHRRTATRRNTYLLRLLIIALLAMSWALYQRQSRPATSPSTTVPVQSRPETQYETEFVSSDLRSIEWLLLSPDAPAFETQLKLEPMQKEHLDNYRRAFTTARATRESHMSAACRGLQQLRAHQSPDKEELSKQQKRVKELSRSLFDARLQEVLRIRDLLNPDQRATLLAHFNSLSR
ncbi:MAG TPA: Spy/CpxP family protein refolding chaperone, partial [Candidatus Ozemobacteraceae bacterium]|nr:Spy/CpxP family protein refolding chaperone [Candidatus Ozemobacteraceae bacterium]